MVKKLALKLGVFHASNTWRAESCCPRPRGDARPYRSLDALPSDARVGR